jgi:endoglucanase
VSRAVVAWALVVAACGAASATRAPRVELTADASLPPSVGLHVERNRLVDRGAVVRLLGVNHSGTEYACVKGTGIFDGPRGDALANAITSWHANTIRIPLNEHCWLGLQGIDPRFSGAAYRASVAGYVRELRARGLYVIVDLHWAAPSEVLADHQLPMADADSAVDFWTSVAQTFADDAGVLFDVFNEPFLDSALCTNGHGASIDSWACLRDGCVVSTADALTYRTVGTQALVDAIRGAGAHNVILIPGLSYSSDLSRWLEHAPRDPLGQIAASLHLYNFSGCTDDECFSRRFDAVAAAVPLVAGEIGENDCGHAFVDDYMTWADRRGVSYLGWVWNPWDCKKGPALITSWDGTPTTYGEGLRRHLARR